MLTREPLVLVGNGQHFVEEFNDGVVCNQALAVLGEYGGHPDGVVHGQADEPAKQQVVLGLFHEHAFGADAVEDLQQHGT